MAALLEEQDNKLAEEARLEYEAEKNPSDEKPEESKAEPQPEAVEPAKEEAEPVKADEKPAEETKVEAEPAKEEEKPVEVSADEEKVINDWALKNQMTFEEAKEDLEKTKAVVSKYKSPEEMAKALRITQSAYDKARAEQAKEKEAEVFRPSANPKLEVMTFVDANKDDLINKFRSQYPAKSRDMEDDAIIEEVSDKLLQGFTSWQEQQMKSVQSQAVQRREQLIAGIPEADRRFLPDVKAVVDKTADHVVLSKNFSLGDIVRWAKGSRYDADVKAAEERGYKRAKEEAKIVGIVPSGSSSTKVKSTGGSSVVLSDYDKRRAREMYGTTRMTDDEMFQAYAELTKNKKKK